MSVGSLLLAARLRARLSQSELAEVAGTTASALSAYENDRKTPRTDVFLRILDAAGMTIDVREQEPSSNEISNVLSEMLAALVEANPSLVERIAVLVEDDRYRSGYADVWRSLAAAGSDAVAAVLGSKHPSARPLKTDCPLWLDHPIDDEIRTQVIEAVRAA